MEKIVFFTVALICSSGKHLDHIAEKENICNNP